MANAVRQTYYLDNAATTRPDPAVVEGMTRVLTDGFGNPSSRHTLGLAAEKELRKARSSVARRLDLAAEQLLFTSGGTEALALALLGTSRARRKAGHILISALEHDAVGKTAQMAHSLGHHIEQIPVTSAGWVDPERVSSLLRNDTFLVAVMHINNETGIIQPIETIARRVHQHNPSCRVLVDAVQSFTVLETELPALGADLLALSAHKIHGPKGVGCLALADGVAVAPLWSGGGQERGLRTGTENLPGIVGLGIASQLGRGAATLLRQRTMALAQSALDAVQGAYLLGDAAQRAPHIAAVALPGLRSDVVVNALGSAGVFVSSGSACHSRNTRRSHVLEAMGVPPEHGVIRISPSRLLTEQQLQQAADIIVSTLRTL